MKSAAAIFAFSFALPTLLVAAPSGEPGHRFRVVVANGVPQLWIDGKPARSRIFWGGPGSGGSATIGAAWKEIVFEFVAPETDNQAALHLRFGEEPGEVWFDDIAIADLTAGSFILESRFEDKPETLWERWQMWCQGRENAPRFEGRIAAGEGRDGGGALHLVLGKDEKLHGLHLYRPQLTLVRDHRYRVTVWARASSGRPLTPTVHHQGGDFRTHGGMPPAFSSQARLAAACDIDIVSFPIPTLWPKPDGESDPSGIERAIRIVLDANPKALLLPRIGMNPPQWWLDAHPDAVMVYEGNEPGKTACVSSPAYREAAAEALRRTIRWCEEHFGPHMAGYHPCGQNTGEWFYFDSWRHPLNGLDPATLSAWRRWLAKNYQDDTAMQRAWGDSTAVRATAEVPTPEERRNAPHGQLRDPSREMRLIDFARFQQEEMADTVLVLARALRRAAGPDRLSVFFYGYVFEFGALPNGPAVSGHYGLRRVLDSPDIDILCSPISYHDRGAGGGAPCMTAAESVMLAGKLWLNEDDTRTHLTRETGFPGWRDGSETQAGTVQLLRRNLVQETTRNFGAWWMDLGSSGWFDDPVLWREMDRLRSAEEFFLKNPAPFEPEIALVLDEAALLLPVGSGPVPWTTRPLIYEIRARLHRAGAPFGQYLIEDALGGRVRARLYVFPAAWRLTAPGRAALKEAVRDSASLWCWAPGYYDDAGPSADSVEDLTGFRVKPMPPGTTVQMKATAEGRAIGLPDRFGEPKPVVPLLSPQPVEGDAVLATFGDGSPAVVARENGNGVAVFSAGTELPTPLLRHAARLAGVHLYCDTDANIYVNGPLLGVHAAADGPLRLRLRQPASLRNLVTGETLPKSDILALELKTGETAVFWSE